MESLDHEKKLAMEKASGVMFWTLEADSADEILDQSHS
jgi:hypothetical protein